jgi:hypothetical protein
LRYLDVFALGVFHYLEVSARGVFRYLELSDRGELPYLDDSACGDISGFSHSLLVCDPNSNNGDANYDFVR